MRSLVRRLCILGASVALALIPAAPAFAAPRTSPVANQPLVDYPTDMPSIGVSVIQDGLDSSGNWVQTVRLTIGPGGTLADASLVVFGDVNHVDTLFQAAQRANPHLYSPAMIPVGQQIDLRIDPSTVFVLEAVLHGPNTLVQRFTNGAVNTVYGAPNGSVTAMLTFPAGKPTDLFRYPGPVGPIKVHPGGRVVDLRFAKGETFANVVQQTYGVATYLAAVDLTHQTGWDPTRWPPPTGETKRVITEPAAAYAATPREVPAIPSPDPVARARQVALHQQRLKAGIYAVRQEVNGTVYHVAVTDPGVTASELSNLIYGTTAHRLDVARAAGYQIPQSESGPAERFDPHLLGRAFDLAVDYQDENFVLWRKIEPDGARQVSLVDGTEVTTYPDSSHGMVEMEKYPTRYKRIVYRPSKLSLTLAQGLGIFHVASNLNLPSSSADALAQEYAAHVIWQWSPGIPREPGDIADTVQLVDEPAGPVVEAVVGPPVPQTVVDGMVDRLRLQNPLIAVIFLVVGGAVTVVAADLVIRYARRPRGLRW